MYDMFSHDPEVQHQFVLLAAHRANLKHWRKQAVAYGGYELAPPITKNGTNECVTNIRRIRKTLIDWGYAIDLQEGEETYV